MAHLPEEVVETIIAKLTSNRDRNSASLVSKSWYSVDRDSRRAVYVGNCYALSPERAIRRFPMLRSLTLKGKPSISDSRLLPNNWGGFFDPWIEVLSNNCPSLEKLRLKRMVVSDRSLQLIPISFPCFKSLILNSCSGFTISGLTAIASNCSMLEEFELEKSDVTDNSGGEWLSNFPESLCSLTSLNISSIRGLMNPTDLEQLVTRSPNLTRLTLNITTTSDTIRRILLKAPQLTHLGAGSNNPQLQINLYTVLASSFHKCKSIKSLALFHLIPPILLRSIYPICPNLVHLNLRCVVAGIQSLDLIRFIKNCPNLQRLSILDTIGDAGLQVVSHTCKNLQELKIYRGRTVVGVTDIGLTAISTGCQNLRSLRYLCTRMTNTALITFSKNCSSTTCFKLTMLIPKQPDHTTQQPLDDGFRAIVQSCKDLRKLTLAGLLTDQVFLYIGMYAEKLEELSVLRAGESDAGMQYVFNGCKNLRKVEIIDCPFGNGVLSSGLFEESGCMRWLWMSSCRTTLGGCKMIAQRKESLNVEIITKNGDMEGDYPDDGMKVDKVYMYQALDGPRADASQHVWTL